MTDAAAGESRSPSGRFKRPTIADPGVGIKPSYGTVRTWGGSQHIGGLPPEDPVMPELQWARLKTDVNCGLRRGAWYRVIRLTLEDALLDVEHKPLTIPRDYLEFVSVPPDQWTVVPRPKDAIGPAASWNSYGVCPKCHHRMPLRPPTPEARCPRCSGLFKVAWGTLGVAGSEGRERGSRS